MRARQTEAERLRMARRIFERAMADNVSVPEARQRLSDEAHALATRDRQRLAAAIKRCGRFAAPVAAPEMPVSAPVRRDDSDDGLQWWQR